MGIILTVGFFEELKILKKGDKELAKTFYWKQKVEKVSFFLFFHQLRKPTTWKT